MLFRFFFNVVRLYSSRPVFPCLCAPPCWVSLRTHPDEPLSWIFLCVRTFSAFYHLNSVFTFYLVVNLIERIIPCIFFCAYWFSLNIIFGRFCHVDACGSLLLSSVVPIKWTYHLPIHSMITKLWGFHLRLLEIILSTALNMNPGAQMHVSLRIIWGLSRRYLPSERLPPFCQESCACSLPGVFFIVLFFSLS